SLGAKGMDVEAALAADLALAIPSVPWHTQRDNLCEVATVLGLIVATLGKLARDVALLAQTEVGEVSEPAKAGRGGWSKMPPNRRRWRLARRSVAISRTNSSQRHRVAP